MNKKYILQHDGTHATLQGAVHTRTILKNNGGHITDTSNRYRTKHSCHDAKKTEAVDLRSIQQFL